MDPAISSDMTRKTTGGYGWGYLPVAVSVDDMSSANPPQFAYDELATWRQMSEDCRAVGANLRLPPLQRAAEAALTASPSIHFADFPREVGKREIRVSDAAARLAGALHLHLD
jgi:hypothetical protein